MKPLANDLAFDLNTPTTSLELSPPNSLKTTEETPFRPLKIALLGYRSHPHVGGQGIYLTYLSRALHAMGHTVHVYSGPPYPELDDDIPLIKVPSLDLYAHENHMRALRWHHLRAYSDVYEWWTMATGGFGEPYTFGRRIQRQLKHSDYDIIHDNQSLCDGLVTLQNHGHTVVSTLHHPIHQDRQLAIDACKNWGERLLVKRWYSFLNMQERVVKKLHHIVTVSHTSQADIATHFKRPAAQTPVISNGIDTHTFTPQPHIKTVPYRLITTASADQPLKGLAFLLEAVALLCEDYPELNLRVIGKVKEGGSTDTLLKTLKLQDRVSFISGISTQALVEEYAAAQIAVSPSLYEGFGLPAGEAMACGLPIIATDGGALPEVVGEAGHIVPKGNSHAIADKIRWLLAHPSAMMNDGLRAREHIVQKFSWENVAQALTQYYYDILNTPK